MYILFMTSKRLKKLTPGNYENYSKSTDKP